MSDKSIVEKLLVRKGDQVLLIDPPAGYMARIGALPKDAALVAETQGKVDVIQVFVKNQADLEQKLPGLKERLAPGGRLWVAYPKGATKTKSDVNRDTIRAYAQTLGMEGVAIFAVDEVWASVRLRYE
jgi:hypothetical protein